ncbi:hypothetical protein [Neobacillus sp. 19]|uniref:hypothetical protein n=1 Tax=Neobacillus sp. 19 TaxID=3394458 RepID=UPI003BF75D4A
MSSGGLSFDFASVVANMNTATSRVRQAAKDGMHDSVDDLKRIAVDIAPIDSSDLRRSGNTTVRETAGDVVGEVSFSAVDNSGGTPYNYAIWIHEGEYNLGPLSAGSPGTDGYDVGNKYLERPLKGEADKYVRWIADEIKDAVGD